jgi:RNA polymerase sigma-70 factor (ECF subfamily)
LREYAVIRPQTDHQLVAAMANGDAAAIEPLYDKFSRAVFTLLVRIVKDRSTAEDLLQDVFASAWQHAVRFDPAKGEVLPWLLGIGHNAALNELRRRRRRPQAADLPNVEHAELLFGRLADPSPTPDEVVWFEIRRGDLRRALSQLPEADRTVIELFATGHSQSEIAGLLESPLGTVKTRMRRGLQRLREAAERQEFEWD